MIFEKSVLPKPSFPSVLLQKLESEKFETLRQLLVCKKRTVSKLKVESVLVSQVLSVVVPEESPMTTYKE